MILVLSMGLVNAHGGEEREVSGCSMHSATGGRMHEELTANQHEEMHETMHGYVGRDNWFIGLMKFMRGE